MASSGLVSGASALVGLIGSCDVSREHSLPLKRVHVNIQTSCVLASVEAVLEYTNDTDTRMEVEFVMPMESISVVTGLSARLDGREVRGQVRRKEEARQEYDDAVSSGLTTLYGEQKGKDLFRMLLGNLSAGGSAELRLSLLQEMEREEGEAGEGGPLRFCLPTTLKPRYIPPTSGAVPVGVSAGASSSSSGEGIGVEYELSVEMIVAYVGGVSRIVSPSHKISTGEIERRDQQWRVQLIDPNPLEKDFVVLLYPSQPAVPALLWGAPSCVSGLGKGQQQEEEKKGSKTLHQFATSRALMLSFLPQFGEAERNEVLSEIIFVIDRSGSMRGDAIRSARATLELLVRSLSPGCAMNVVGFGSEHSSLFPDCSSNSYDEESVEKAVAYARTLTANMGGTEILSPLQDVFRREKRPGLPRQVILLTDGGVSNTEQVLRCVRENRGQVRVFTIGIGSSVSSELVRGMAEAGGGRAVFVSEGERMQGKILKLLSDALTPCYTDVSLSVSGGSDGLSVFPSQLPQLFPRDRLLVYVLVASGVSVEGRSVCLQYRQGEKSYSHQLSLQQYSEDNGSSSSEAVKGEWIHKLCCNAVLREWEQTEGREEECIQLSCDTNLVCAHTALVGVDSEVGQVVAGTMQHIKLKPVSYSFENVLFNSTISRSLNSFIPGDLNSTIPINRGLSSPFVGSYHQPYESIALSALSASSQVPLDEREKRIRRLEKSRMYTCKSRSRAVKRKRTSSLTSDLPPTPLTLSPHEQLISQQSAQGYWERSEELDKLLQLSDSEKQLCPEGVGEREWRTLLCLLTLEQKYAEYQDEWQLIARKAWKWLRSCQLSVSLEAATEAARKAILS